MNQLICNLWNWIVKVNWLDVLTDLATIGTFIVAFMALKVWRQQEKSKRTVDYFDKLTDAIHEYVNSINVPIQKLEFIFIGIDSCQLDMAINRELKYPEAIRFIEKEGRERAKELFADLSMCSEAAFRIRSLVTKGQVMNIDGFSDCYNACQMIVWQYDRMQAFAGMLGMSTANWENEEVINRLGEVLQIKPDGIRSYLDENQQKYLNYVRSVYSKEYGSA